MSLLLFDPLQAPADAWPEGREMERRYIEAVAHAGPGLVANVRTRWMALRSGGRLYPVTVNDGEYGDSYVCLPHSGYVLYGRRELDLVDVGRLRPWLRAGLGMLDVLLRAARVNRIVHVDNWLLSTNLHGDWNGSDARAIRELLQERYPGHLIAVRSVDPWSSPQLDAALRADGWLMLPSRQLWVLDSLPRQWRPRRAARHDRRLLTDSGLAVEDLRQLQPGDAERIATLYRMLYVDKYSGLNPVFTPAWITCTQRSGVIRYRVARDSGGTIQSVAGSLVRGDVLTPPVVGYDTSRPREDGLYRIASYLFCEQAEALGLRLNASAGAADFKRTRGARPVIECSAVWAGGVAPWRRWLLRVFGMLLWRVVVPVMRRRQL
ncbi:MAG TPA: hypothetical protein VFE82_15890 [Ramlibacter sp.]|uniref:hypothetical protein n=1 Tax=Ramlibacter sp. TaxID=1917967 RepID=UPI002D2B010C|nr:hypothetical protein [Ramlibacter sp.]HZY19954.1 hypothetical protein [Ramlibacter sp.]